MRCACYRDGLALVERVGDEEVEGALRFRLDAGSVMAALSLEP